MDGDRIDAGFRESVDGFGLLVHRSAPTHDDLKSKFGLYKLILNSQYRKNSCITNTSETSHKNNVVAC